MDLSRTKALILENKRKKQPSKHKQNSDKNRQITAAYTRVARRDAPNAIQNYAVLPVDKKNNS